MAIASPGSWSTLVSERDWSKLAYQFGHELGHVFANSWQANAKPMQPCQWIEEALVEALSLRGLGRLAERWKQNPPFPKDNGFSNTIADYQRDIANRYSALAREQGLAGDPAKWFAAQRAKIEIGGGLNQYAQAASFMLLQEYERPVEA
jgi:hypothetical protein